MILYHVCPPLGIQHCLYYRCTLVKLLYDSSPLDYDPVLVIVAEVTAPDLIPSKKGVVVHNLGILLICGSTGLSDRPTMAWTVSGSVVTLHILHHNLWLRHGVLSVL